MNAKQRRVFRRAIARRMDEAYGFVAGPVPLCRRLRESPGFWFALGRGDAMARGDVEEDRADYDPWDDDDWSDEVDRDEDDDPVGCWESGKLRPGFCADDLCHSANRCMMKTRPWEDGDSESEGDEP